MNHPPGAPDEPSVPPDEHHGLDDRLDDRLDDLAVYVLDGLDGDEALAVEAGITDDPASAAIEQAFREATAAFTAAADPLVEVAPPLDLRARVLAAAHARRPPAPTESAPAIDVHHIELERFELLLRRLTGEQWRSGVAPAEFAGWTIHDLAAHVAANEALLAQLLGTPVDGVPETHTENDPRTYEALERHRSLSTDVTLAELHRSIAAVHDAVAALNDDELERPVPWWGADWPLRAVLTFRAFETWTHADDIRRAIGLPVLPAPAGSLKTMSATAASLTPLMLAAAGHDHTGRTVRLHLTGPGGGRYDVALGLGVEAIDLGGVMPDAEITLDVVAYCQVIGDRLPSAAVAYEAVGDTALAGDVISSLNALATL